MIELIQDLPDDVIGFNATGKVTGDDYEDVLIPAMEAVLEKQDKVRALALFGPEFDGYEAEAMWDDAKVGMKHYTGWEKIAIVTDVEWMTRSVKVFGFLVPGEIKLFGNDQLDEAKAWVVE